MLLVGGSRGLSQAVRTILMHATQIIAMSVRVPPDVSVVGAFQTDCLVCIQPLWEALKLTHWRSGVCVSILWYLVPRWRHSRLRS